MEKLLNRIWYALLVIIFLMIFEPSPANATDLKTEIACRSIAEHAETIHKAYVKDIDIGAIIIVYQGNDKWSVGMRDLVTKIYRSDSKDLDSKAVYRFFYTICVSK